ncbi:sulfotransferase [Roseitranquillus sediminis]|uniref:sulfotransferase n=1 Tax=Roseitranquillus sediminis TaxID=2809051 RepID=UPI001D0C0805|nr:sulfotransferase [Roseitranquillus sediminis]MBM9593910.1 sulfotransferase [Roseitranquillus sediminis]
MQNVFFHIGFPKTATTTLQRTMRDFDGCAYLGKGLRDSLQPSDSLEIARAVFFADTRRFEAMLPDLRTRLARHAAASPCVFVSDEAFAFAEHMVLGRKWQRQVVTDHETVAERLSRIAPGAGILFSVREQVSLLESFYRQHVKIDALSEPFGSYIQREIDALPHRSMLHHLRYDEVFSAYRQRFGDRILVSVYEAYAQDFGGYLDDVARFCGMDAAGLRASWQGRRLNENVVYGAFTGRLRRHVPDRLLATLSPARRQAIRRRLSRGPAEVAWSGAQRQAVAAHFERPNATFAWQAGLDLERFGYILPEPDVTPVTRIRSAAVP